MHDYDRIARAIEYITQHAQRQPTLAEIAAHVELSEFHFQRLFSRWAGVSPKRFQQALTVERAKRLLRSPRPLLEVADAVGLSGGSRLYDHFVHLEAVTPGEYKTGGRGLAIHYAVHDTPFGGAFLAATSRGVCSLQFTDHEAKERCTERLRAQWPQATLREDSDGTRHLIDRMFLRRAASDRPLSLLVRGTNFQVSVWRALLAIPPGSVATYRVLAEAVGRPTAARAVGQAVGANPIAYLIPCHRVIRESGDLGGYHWGSDRKRALLAWEAVDDGESSGSHEAGAPPSGPGRSAS